MPFSYVTADDEQLAALAKLLDDYSRQQGIEGDDKARECLAARIIRLFDGGLTPEDIGQALASIPKPPAIDQSAA